MPWNEVTLMSLREEFIMLALNEEANMTDLCKQFNISRKTGYKWLNRYSKDGISGIENKSKRPVISPLKTDKDTEKIILKIRDEHPQWGARKIKTRLYNLGYKNMPAKSTINDILKRNNRIKDNESQKHKAYTRFEADKPNDLWQMDFKGWIYIQNGTCHPFTVIDDHSRFSLGLKACSNQKEVTVKEHLVSIFRQYGLPETILADNGTPFGASGQNAATGLEIWLMKRDIKLIHGRPYHPQTQGKIERFHRTLKEELLNYCSIYNLDSCEKEFKKWRDVYNLERPHEAIDMKVPAEKYIVSKRKYLEITRKPEYDSEMETAKVDVYGRISFKKKRFRIPKAYKNEYVGVKETDKGGVMSISIIK
jgi:transposase InsO family protein